MSPIWIHASPLVGQEHAFPILLAPVASLKLAHPDGELATARGASAASITMVVSSFSNTSLEDVVAAAKTPLWFQLYTHRDRGFTRELVQRAEHAENWRSPSNSFCVNILCREFAMAMALTGRTNIGSIDRSALWSESVAGHPRKTS